MTKDQSDARTLSGKVRITGVINDEKFEAEGEAEGNPGTGEFSLQLNYSHVPKNWHPIMYSDPKVGLLFLRPTRRRDFRQDLNWDWIRGTAPEPTSSSPGQPPARSRCRRNGRALCSGGSPGKRTCHPADAAEPPGGPNGPALHHRRCAQVPRGRVGQLYGEVQQTCGFFRGI